MPYSFGMLDKSDMTLWTFAWVYSLVIVIESSLDVHNIRIQLKKYVDILTQLVIEVAQSKWRRRNTFVALCIFRCLSKAFMPEALGLLRLKLFVWKFTSFSNTLLTSKCAFSYLYNNYPVIFTKKLLCSLILEELPKLYPALKAVDTIGNCQRPLFSLGVSQHMHKITNLWKFEPNRSSKLRDNNEIKKNALVTRSCVHLDGWFRDLKF